MHVIQNAEAINVRINTKESNEILKVLTEAIVGAGYINQSSDPEAKLAISAFLKDIEDEITGFFRKNVDRRQTPREQPMIADMKAYYRISSRFC